MTTSPIVPSGSARKGLVTEAPTAIVLQAREVFADALDSLTGPAKEHRKSFERPAPSRPTSSTSRNRARRPAGPRTGDESGAVIPPFPGDRPEPGDPLRSGADPELGQGPRRGAVTRETGESFRAAGGTGSRGATPVVDHPAVGPETGGMPRPVPGITGAAARPGARPLPPVVGATSVRPRPANQTKPPVRTQRVRRPPAPEMLRDQILDKVRLRLAAGRATAEIRLDPPDLGRLSIEIDHHEGKLIAAVRVEHDAVADIVQRYVQDLRDLFMEAGIAVERFEVIRERPERRGEVSTRGRGRERRQRTDADENEAAPSERSWPRRIQGMVDVVV